MHSKWPASEMWHTCSSEVFVTANFFFVLQIYVYKLFQSTRYVQNFGRKTEGKKLLRIPRRKREGNIKVDLKDGIFLFRDWTVAPCRERGNVILGYIKLGNLLAKSAAISSSKGTLLFGVVLDLPREPASLMSWT